MSAPPRPATEPVHDVEIELVPLPLIVQVGEPFFLKCTLAPNAAVVANAAIPRTAKMIEIRRMSNPFWIRSGSDCGSPQGASWRWVQPNTEPAPAASGPS